MPAKCRLFCERRDKMKLGQFDYRPVNATLKSKCIIKCEPEPPVRSAYMKRLREHDNTKKVYETDPYVEVYQFRDNLFCLFSESLCGVADQWSFVLTGPEKALVIDTGFPVGNLKGLVEELIGDLPYDVVNTHGHEDHAGGNCQFDRVYCHKYDIPAVKEMEGPHFVDHLLDGDGKPKYTEFDLNDLVPYRDYELVGIEDGYVFHLGQGYDVEVIHCPGHSAGSICLLDRQNRILFGGDEMCIGVLHMGFLERDDPYFRYTTVQSLRDGLVNVMKHRDEFDGIFPSHGILDVGADWVQDILDTCNEIIEDPERYDARMPAFVGMGDYDTLPPRYCKKIHDSGYITYNLDQVM